MLLSTEDFTKELFGRTGGGISAYLLLDGAQFENLPAIIYSYDEQPTVTALFAGTYYEPAVKAGPYLVHVAKENALFNWFMQEGVKAHAGIALTSRLDFAASCEHLRSWLEVTLPNYNLAIFRYYDPVVCSRIMQSMSAAEKKALIGELEAMYWPVHQDEDIQWDYFHRDSL